MLGLGKMLFGSAGGIVENYTSKVESYSPLAYWKMDESDIASDIGDNFNGGLKDSHWVIDTQTFGAFANNNIELNGSGDLDLYTINALLGVGDFEADVSFTINTQGSDFSLDVIGEEYESASSFVYSRYYSSAGVQKYSFGDDAGERRTETRTDLTGKIRLQRIGANTTGYLWNGSAWEAIGTSTYNSNKLSGRLVFFRLLFSSADPTTSISINEFTVLNGGYPAIPHLTIESVSGDAELFISEEIVSSNSLIYNNGSGSKNFSGRYIKTSYRVGIQACVFSFKSASASPSARDCVIHFNASSATSGATFWIRDGGSNYMCLGLNTNGNSVVQSDTAYAVDTIYHVVITYDLTNTYFFINGVKQTNFYVGNFFDRGTDDIVISSYQYTTGAPVVRGDKVIDDVALFSAGFSDVEAIELYDLTIPPV